MHDQSARTWRPLKLMAATLAALIALGAASAASAAPVATDAGLVEGVQQDGVVAYKGIPFAAPSATTAARAVAMSFNGRQVCAD